MAGWVSVLCRHDTPDISFMETEPLWAFWPRFQGWSPEAVPRARVKSYCRWAEWKTVGDGWRVWGCYCEQFSITKINLFYWRLRRGKVRARTCFSVGIYVFLAALLLRTHQCQLIDPDLACWLSPPDSKKVLLRYIGSRDKIYSAVPSPASLPWPLWLHCELGFFYLFISFVFLYYWSLDHSIFGFQLHPVEILTDGKLWAVNRWCL